MRFFAVLWLLIAAACASAAVLPRRAMLDMRGAQAVEVGLPQNATKHERYAARLLRGELCKMLELSAAAHSDGESADARNAQPAHFEKSRAFVKKTSPKVFRITLENTRALDADADFADILGECSFETQIGACGVKLKYPAHWKAAQAVGLFLRKYCRAEYFSPAEFDADYSRSSLLFVRGRHGYAPPFFSAVFSDASYSRRWRSLNGIDIASPYTAFSHNLGRIFTPEILEKYPQCAPLDKFGRSLSNAQFNLSNYISAEIAAEAAERAFSKGVKMFSVGIDDTPNFGWRDEHSGLKRGYFRDYPDWSNLVFDFANRAAEKSAKTRPHGLVGALAYLVCENPPDFKLHKNVVPYFTTDRANYAAAGYAAADFSTLEKWGECASATFGIYDYLYGFPYLFPREISRYVAAGISKAHASRARLYYAETLSNWGFDAFKMYTVARFLENPRADFSVVKSEFFTRYYKAAAGNMLEFFDTAESVWANRKTPPQWLAFFKAENAIELFDAAALSKMDAALRRAETAAAGDSAVSARVAQTRDSFSITLSAHALFCAKMRIWRAAADGGVWEISRALEDYLNLRGKFLERLGTFSKKYPYAKGYDTYIQERYAPTDSALLKLERLGGGKFADELRAKYGNESGFAKSAEIARKIAASGCAFFQWGVFDWRSWEGFFSKMSRDFDGVRVAAAPDGSKLSFGNCQLSGISKSFDYPQNAFAEFSGRVSNRASAGTLCYASLLFLDGDNFVVGRKTLIFPSNNNIDFTLLGGGYSNAKKVVISLFATRQKKGEAFSVENVELKLYRGR